MKGVGPPVLTGFTAGEQAVIKIKHRMAGYEIRIFEMFLFQQALPAGAGQEYSARSRQSSAQGSSFLMDQAKYSANSVPTINQYGRFTPFCRRVFIFSKNHPPAGWQTRLEVGVVLRQGRYSCSSKATGRFIRFSPPLMIRPASHAALNRTMTVRKKGESLRFSP